jgi:LuxR family quorum-sensing system transcriptional regulator CciR
MGMHMLADRFVRTIAEARTTADLSDAMAGITQEMGFQYYALSHHVDALTAAGTAIRLHNYPSPWAQYYDRHGLGVSDPVHRASHVTSVGFRWSAMARMIPLTVRDRRMLALGREEGIGDGFTVPANVPGEARGSCSFANDAARPIPEEMLRLAQLAGAFAFEGARRLWLGRGQRPDEAAPVLTDRQRDCVLWVARGKGDWEISRILDICEDTVARHIKMACQRYGVNKRTLLAIRTLFDGTLTFTDIVQR